MKVYVILFVTFLAPKLPISQYHTPRPSQRLQRRLVSPESEESKRRPQRGSPQPNQTEHLDQYPDLHQYFVPAKSERPVADHASCRLDREYFPAAGAGDTSSASTADPVPIVELLLTFEGARS